MRAELSKDGTLTITPTTDTEAFALACWYAGQPGIARRKDKTKLVVATEVVPASTAYTGNGGIAGWGHAIPASTPTANGAAS